MLVTDLNKIENALVMQVDQLDSQIVTMRRGDTLKNRSFAKLNQVDLSGIEMLRVTVTTSKRVTIGEELTLRLGSTAGETIGRKNLGIPISQARYNLAVSNIGGAHDIFLAAETLAASGKTSPNFILLTVGFVPSEQGNLSTSRPLSHNHNINFSTARITGP